MFAGEKPVNISMIDHDLCEDGCINSIFRGERLEINKVFASAIEINSGYKNSGLISSFPSIHPIAMLQ